MNLREFLEIKSRSNSQYFDYTLTVAKAVKDEHTPFYHNEFYQTPVNTIHEWLKGETPDKYIVIKADQSPVDISGIWTGWYKAGHLGCCIVTTEKDLHTLYSEKQANDMIAFYDKEVRKQISTK